MAISRRQLDRALNYKGAPLIPPADQPSLIQRYADAYMWRRGFALADASAIEMYRHFKAVGRDITRFMGEAAVEFGVEPREGFNRAARDWQQAVISYAAPLLRAYGRQASRFTFDRTVQMYVMQYYGFLWGLDTRFETRGIINIPELTPASAALQAMGEGAPIAEQWTNQYGMWTGDKQLWDLLASELGEDFADLVQDGVVGVRNTIRRSMQARRSIPQVGKDIQKRLGITPAGLLAPKALAYKFTTTAHTYMATAMSRARVKAARENPEFLSVIQYGTMRDRAVCPICRPLQGKQWPLNSPDIIYPGETHPNCRCQLHTRVKPAEQLAREQSAKLYPDGTRPTVPFRSWLFEYNFPTDFDKLRNFTWPSPPELP